MMTCVLMDQFEQPCDSLDHAKKTFEPFEWSTGVKGDKGNFSLHDPEDYTDSWSENFAKTSQPNKLTL